MVEFTARLVFLLAFLAAIALYVWRDDKLERHSILFIRRTKKGILTIDKIAKKAPRFWNYYGWAGVVTGVFSIFAAFGMMAYTLWDMISTQSAQNGPSLILPGTVSQTQIQPGATFVPAEYWVISIFVLMTVHELSHGIVARAEDIEIKSVGWAILGILPLGAFVEPEGERMLPEDGEEDGERSHATWDVGNWKSRMKVLCAGSFANYITAAVFVILAMGLTSIMTSPTFFYNAQEGFPAYEEGMRNGTLHGVDGQEVESLAELKNLTDGVKVGEEVELWTSEGNFTVTAGEKEGHEDGYIGILMGQRSTAKAQFEDYQSGINWFLSLLMTVGLLNVLVGLFNMLPVKPLDGGLAAETVIQEFFGEEKVKYLNHFSLAALALLAAMLLLALSHSFL